MKKWFMVAVTLLHQKPYQKDAMSLNTLDKYILGDIEPMALVYGGRWWIFSLVGRKTAAAEAMLQWGR